MKMISKTLALALALSVAGNGYTCTVDGSEGFLPENDMYIPTNAKSVSTVDEATFNSVIDKVETLYAPVIASAGAKLSVVRNWTDGTVNAYASRSGSTWVVQMFGGLARHETITADGLALVVCHELGHHIGGAPKKGAGGGWWGGGASSWASNEGQSDYFANLKCLRKVWLNDDNAAIVRAMEVPETLSAACANAFRNADESAICVRGGMAGMSVAKLFQALRNAPTAPAFDTPDRGVVTRTNDAHPAYQCRLDTYFQGSLCEVADNVDVSDSDEKAGTCHPASGHTIGARPLCWFKPAAI